MFCAGMAFIGACSTTSLDTLEYQKSKDEEPEQASTPLERAQRMLEQRIASDPGFTDVYQRCFNTHYALLAGGNSIHRYTAALDRCASQGKLAKHTKIAKYKLDRQITSDPEFAVVYQHCFDTHVRRLSEISIHAFDAEFSRCARDGIQTERNARAKRIRETLNLDQRIKSEPEFADVYQ